MRHARLRLCLSSSPESSAANQRLLARTLALTLDGEHKRIQFTNDLMPSDVVGAAIWRPDHGKFVFVRRAGDAPVGGAKPE